MSKENTFAPDDDGGGGDDDGGGLISHRGFIKKGNAISLKSLGIH